MYLWFGVVRADGDALTLSDGAVTSAQTRATSGSWSEVCSANYELTCTTSNPRSSDDADWLVTMWSRVCELPSQT